MSKIWKEIKFLNNNQNSNNINELYNDKGNTTMNTDDLIDIINKHLTNTFHKDNNPTTDILDDLDNLEKTHTYTNRLNNSTKKRNNSHFTQFMSKTHNINHKITHTISKKEIIEATKSQKNDKSTGNDWIPAEIFKQNIDEWATYLEKYFNNINNGEMPDLWKQGVVILIPKTGDKRNINNYRPITLLNSIYKIWATIITNKLKPYMNLRTCEMQHGYKIKKSTVDIIYHTKRNFMKK